MLCDLSLAQRGMMPRCVHTTRHPRTKQLHGISITVSGGGHDTRKRIKIISKCHPMCTKVRTRCRSPPHNWFLAGCSPPLMRLAEHLAALGAWFLVHAPFSWSVKTRCSQSRHCSGARAYGLKTAAMHESGSPPPSPISPYGASRLAQAMPAGLVTTRRAPSRRGGDADA